MTNYCHTSMPMHVFAGDIDTQRSTSGLYSVVRGPNSSFPISAGSKRQSCVSHSTLEAELVAADFGLRTDGLPSLSLWRVLFSPSTAIAASCRQSGNVLREDDEI